MFLAILYGYQCKMQAKSHLITSGLSFDWRLMKGSRRPYLARSKVSRFQSLGIWGYLDNTAGVRCLWHCRFIIYLFSTQQCMEGQHKPAWCSQGNPPACTDAKRCWLPCLAISPVHAWCSKLLLLDKIWGSYWKYTWFYILYKCFSIPILTLTFLGCWSPKVWWKSMPIVLLFWNWHVLQLLNSNKFQ